jgi:hypothetical protein
MFQNQDSRRQFLIGWDPVLTAFFWVAGLGHGMAPAETAGWPLRFPGVDHLSPST